MHWSLRLLLYPGILFHELAHAATCILLGAKIHRFQVSLNTTSGLVEYTAPKSVLAALCIAASPVLAALSLTLGLAWFYQPTDPRLLAALWYLKAVLLYCCLPSRLDTQFWQPYSLPRKIAILPLWLPLKLLHLMTRHRAGALLWTASLLFALYWLPRHTAQWLPLLPLRLD